MVLSLCSLLVGSERTCWFSGLDLVRNMDLTLVSNGVLVTGLSD